MFKVQDIDTISKDISLDGSYKIEHLGIVAANYE